MKVFSSGSGNTIVINGVTYRGNNVTVNDGEVIVDGVSMSKGNVKIDIVINGNVDKVVLTEQGSVNVKGNVGGDVETQSGNISCGDVNGSAKTMSGNISCKSIHGNAKTMSGNICH